MMDPKENDITNHLFILPDTQKEYLRQLFTNNLENIENVQNVNHFLKMCFTFLDRKTSKLYEYTQFFTLVQNLISKVNIS